MRLFTVASTPPSALPPRSGRVRTVAALLACSALLGGCDMLGIDTPAKQAARREADGRAIGAGCRHTQRSLEDCYAANPKAPKAAIYAGWREMDEYMRENKLDTIAPQLPPPQPPNAGKKKKKANSADTDLVPEAAPPAVPAPQPAPAAPATAEPGNAPAAS